MHPIISIGTQSFEKIRSNHSFYIDKTAFIKEWWENLDDVTLITRPRRFGKTLNLNMMECFFSKDYAGRADLFEGLSIWNDETYHALQGSYPAISLSFANIKGETFEAAREGIIQLFVSLYGKYDFLRSSGAMARQDLEYFNSVNLGMSGATAALALHSLSCYLHRYYDKKVLIFLDEYDTPLQEAYVHGYWDKMASFIRILFNSTFKTNPSMERGLLTGITRVSKESIFSDLNNLEAVTTTSEKYCTQFGFTEQEVFTALDSFGMASEKGQVKQWYDGFTFGSQKDIYNPWSITSFLDKKKYAPYWANSSSNELVNKLVQQGNPQTKIDTEDLLAGKQLQTVIDEEIVFNQLQKKYSSIWSLMLASGYLKVEGITFDQGTGRSTYLLGLTNMEVRMMFADMVRDWFAGEDVPYNDFLKALLHGDVDYMNEYMGQIARTTFSCFDTGGGPSRQARPERFYHGFVLGLVVELAGKYKVSSNRESGFGRYDVMLEPLNRQGLAFIFEFKVRNAKREKTLQDTLETALAQIEAKDYDAELTARGIPKERIRHYGFAFEGKHVLIG